jgi:hypothetical protein
MYRFSKNCNPFNSLPSLEPSLCELEKRLIYLNDYESINTWERQAMVLIQQHAIQQRQRLKSSWSVLTVN